MQTDLQICGICSEATTHEHCLQPCPCSTSWCNDCIRQRFLLAIKDLIHMPPTCCGSSIIGLHHARPYLSWEEAAAYRARFDEWRSPLKLYCPVPSCSAFVADTLLDSVDDDQYITITSESMPSGDPQAPPVAALKTLVATNKQPHRPSTVACPKCPNSICLACKQCSHTGQCSELVEKSTIILLRKMGYKRCPGCATGVKRMWGCSQIQCVCGAAWCWVCERLDYHCNGGGSCDAALDDGPDDLRDTSSEPGTDEDEDEDENEDETEDVPDEKTVVEAPNLKDQGRVSTRPIAKPSLVDEEQQNVREVIMSDRNDAEDERRFFGEEPGEFAGLSCCRHRFEPLQYSDIANDYSSRECHRCWTAIRPVLHQLDSGRSTHEPIATHKTRIKHFSQPVNVFFTPKKDAQSCARCHMMFCSDCRGIWERMEAARKRRDNTIL